jgi:hypothetical protein
MSEWHHFSQEELEYLRAGYRRWRFPELTERYNAQFGRNLSLAQVKGAVQNRRMRSGRPPGLARGERPPPVWRPEYVDWMREHRAKLTLSQVVEAFEDRWGVRMTPGQINGVCARYKIAGSDGHFKPGQAPWNRGQKMKPHPNAVATRFQPGNLPTSHVPIFSYVWHGDYWYVKVADTRSRFDWWPVNRLVWETERGPIPKDWVVVFLDGDPHNCLDVENLAAVPRRILGRLNIAGWSELTAVDERRALLVAVQLLDATRQRARELGLSERQAARMVPAIKRFCGTDANRGGEERQ